MSKATTKKSKKKNVEGLPVHNPDAAGIDVSATGHMVAVPPDRADESVRQFGGFTDDLHAIAHWLKDCEVTTVAMESTGVYWKPLFSILLHYGFQVYLVNARQVKNVSGRKTDEDDARWIQKLHSCALLQSSFLPDEDTERVRTLVRHRNTMVADANRYVLRIQKALELMNIKLHSVLSNLMGKSGRAMLEAIIAGEREPENLLQHVDRRVKADHQTIKESLTGYWKAEELFLIEQNYGMYVQLQERMAQCDQKVRQLLVGQCVHTAPEVVLKPEPPASQMATEPELPVARQPKVRAKKKTKNQPADSAKDYLHRIHGVDVTQIYGISETTALRIFSETGTDLSKWEHEGKFVSWLRLCPNNKETGGKIISSRLMKGKAGYASQAFRQAANGIARSDHWLGDYFRRMKAKAGNKYAIIAVARKLAIIYYKMVRYKHAFKPIEVNEYREKNTKAKINYLEKQLARLKEVA